MFYRYVVWAKLYFPVVNNFWIKCSLAIYMYDCSFSLRYVCISGSLTHATKIMLEISRFSSLVRKIEDGEDHETQNQNVR